VKRLLVDLARAVRVAADVTRVLPASVAYARAEHTELPDLWSMTDHREAAETRLRRPR
jgi:hypothetical protein